jgi:hypothetical protein
MEEAYQKKHLTTIFLQLPLRNIAEWLWWRKRLCWFPCWLSNPETSKLCLAILLSQSQSQSSRYNKLLCCAALKLKHKFYEVWCQLEDNIIQINALSIQKIKILFLGPEVQRPFVIVGAKLII